jgi:hypothetical protein
LIIFSSVTDKLVCLRTQGAYLEAHVDINLCSDDDTIITLKPDASASQKMLAGGDAEGYRASSAKPNAPNPISSSSSKQSDPSAADQVLTITPLAGGRDRKRPLPRY